VGTSVLTRGSRGQSPLFYNVSSKRRDLCAHRAGGASTYRFDCALAQTELYAPRGAAKV